MNLKRRIQIIVSELRKRGKDIRLSNVYYLKIDDNKYEKIGSEFELFERLMKEWGKG